MEKEHFKKRMDFVQDGDKKNLEPFDREITFITFRGSLAYKNLLKLFQEEIARQSEDLGKGVWEEYRNMPPDA